MHYRLLAASFFFYALIRVASAQLLSLPGNPGPGSSLGMNASPGPLSIAQETLLDNNLWLINGQRRSPLESLAGSLSKLDLKAPGKAKREFEKGYELLQKKDYAAAVLHLSNATTIYPNFVTAHNSLGNAYLGLKEGDKAREEFAQAVALDDHLPTSFFNLGCSELALKHYLAAEEAIQKASTIAPLDLSLLTALAYGQLMNQRFDAAVKTAEQVHGRKHEGASMVHFYAAAALEAQGNFSAAQHQLETLLKEDPKSPASEQARKLMADLKDEAAHPPLVEAATKVTFTQVSSEPTSKGLSAATREVMQAFSENKQIAEAEAADGCPTCDKPDETAPTDSSSPAPASAANSFPAGSNRVGSGMLLRSSTDEVAVFFAATDHGKAVTDLTGENVAITDDRKPPVRITGFRNEAELPLRLGFIIDTSASVEGRFKFEQRAASNFLHNLVKGKDDLTFVVGFANSVLLVQDFTGDQDLVSRSINQLVPAGGTALWDAVAFAADKLSSRLETKPVARMLVVISDGEDNSSSLTLKEAIAQAQRGEIAVYSISTRDFTDSQVSSLVGEHALVTLSELTGGATFTPGSINRLNGSLNDMQQVIRSRYLISYKPDAFHRDGQYRPIAIQAKRGGKKLRVYARKGYFAAAALPPAEPAAPHVN